MRRGLVTIALCGLLAGCYSSTVLEGDGRSDTRDDAGGDVGDVPVDHGIEADSPAEADVEAGADADADADVGPDGTIECPPPPGDGTWMMWEIDGSTRLDADIDTPCVIASVRSESMGHVLVDLECGTGGIIERHVIDIYSNPPPYLDFWTGTEVNFRHISDVVWWVNRWFMVRDRYGNLLFAGTDADSVAPWGTAPNDWYAPLQVEVLGGVCAPADETCGRHERQALQVTYGGATGRIFDGYYGYVGMMTSVFVFVASATHYLEMRCDDVPDQFYSLLFVLIPEG